jgi:hypothetical protein
MISGGRDERSVTGSWVIPTADGNYSVPPATVIETFWAYKRTPAGVVIADDTDMVLKYKTVDSGTFEIIPFPDGELAKDVTCMMISMWMSTRLHPHFIGGR